MAIRLWISLAGRARRILFALLVASCARAAHAASACAPGLPNAISTSLGCVQGTQNGDGTRESFLGIPYAKPPLGALRFKRPQLHDPWSTPFAATSLGPPCTQP